MHVNVVNNNWELPCGPGAQVFLSLGTGRQ